jgi:tRNA(fMet)-specific endonuclease VapC
MLIISDTNILSWLQQNAQPATDRIIAKLQVISANGKWTTVVTFQEQTKGWLAAIHHAKTDSQLLRSYQALFELVKSFRTLNGLSFDEYALMVFGDLKSKRLGVGTLDLRIAAIALARGDESRHAERKRF